MSAAELSFVRHALGAKQHHIESVGSAEVSSLVQCTEATSKSALSVATAANVYNNGMIARAGAACKRSDRTVL